MAAYTEEQELWLRDNVPGNAWEDITDAFNSRFKTDKRLETLRKHANRAGIKNGISGRFEKGMVPWAKRVSREEFIAHLSDEAKEAMARTQFRPGHGNELSPLTQPIGSIKRLSTSDKGAPTYIIKTGCEGGYDHYKGWELYHFYLWEKYHGMKVPDEHCVVFLDNNYENFDEANLYCCHRRVMACCVKRFNWNNPDPVYKLECLKAAELIIAIKDNAPGGDRIVRRI